MAHKVPMHITCTSLCFAALRYSLRVRFRILPLGITPGCGHEDVVYKRAWQGTLGIDLLLVTQKFPGRPKLYLRNPVFCGNAILFAAVTKTTIETQNLEFETGNPG